MKINPNLKTKNKNKEYLAIAKKYMEKIISYGGVVGIAVGGGLGRGHSDECSDIDIYTYLKPKAYKRWSKNPPLKLGSHKREEGITVELYIFNYKKELKNNWIIQDRWERQSHFAIFDTNSKVKNILKAKCVWKKGEREELLKDSMEMVEWYSGLPKDFITRGNIAHSHYLINVVIDRILDIVFLKNSYFIPWPKWKLHYALLMKKKPKNFDKNIKEAMKVKDFTKKDIERRLKNLDKILVGLGPKKKK